MSVGRHQVATESINAIAAVLERRKVHVVRDQEGRVADAEEPKREEKDLREGSLVLNLAKTSGATNPIPE